MSQSFRLAALPLGLRRLICAFVCSLGCLVAVPAWAGVNPNLASQAELETVRGIGPSMAARIVAERQKNGPFKGPQDFARRVSGVGPKRLKTFQEGGLEIPVAKVPEPSRPR
ncbi:MAG TPA: helix-hairpin-helix domain-containing protein [Burkholderiaceae bacterium]|nr:helix-hairpin-helix domain-containing protein [Burkholderiaceae bacterium]